MNFKSDHIGIIMSCTCIVHCIALPFVLLFMGLSHESELLHGAFLLAAIVITAHAVFHSFKKHCKHIVIFFAAIGISLLASDMILPHHESGVEILPIIGSIFLIITHVLNLYYDRLSVVATKKAQRR